MNIQGIGWNALAIALLFGLAIVPALAADPPDSETAKDQTTVDRPCCGGCGGNGAGQGYRGGGRGRGYGRPAGAGPPAGAGRPPRENIHALLEQHDAIQRSVEDIEGGVLTVTTSDDPEVTATIREHVLEMEQRLASGWAVRHWDPLFVELFRRHEEIRMEIEEIPGGVRVQETSSDPKVALLIRQHAHRGVSEFVADGFARAHKITPMPAGYGEVAKQAEPVVDPCGEAATSSESPSLIP